VAPAAQEVGGARLGPPVARHMGGVAPRARRDRVCLLHPVRLPPSLRSGHRQPGHLAAPANQRGEFTGRRLVRERRPGRGRRVSLHLPDWAAAGRNGWGRSNRPPRRCSTPETSPGSPAAGF
jgi:hypothetical protein